MASRVQPESLGAKPLLPPLGGQAPPASEKGMHEGPPTSEGKRYAGEDVGRMLPEMLRRAAGQDH